MDKKIILTLQTPFRTYFDGEIKMVTVRTYDGYLGLLPNHLPILAKLKEGNFKFETIEGKFIKGNLKSGFLFFQNNECIILAPEVKIINDEKFNQFEVPEFSKKENTTDY